ncbi:MAG: hypothetical protein IJF02_05515 [Oscillospiraceae bacterium]|nr:hypothetical protein [Oscillospiraceae bacterium]
MITMNNWATKAIEKLKGERKSVSGQREEIMAEAVITAIKDFCVQDEKFAQAVVQGGTFADCMKAVAKDVGRSISDIDAYKKAVRFYLPEAKVKMQLAIELTGNSADENKPTAEPVTETQKQNMILDLADFFN